MMELSVTFIKNSPGTPICSKSFTDTIRRRGFSRSLSEAVSVVNTQKTSRQLTLNRPQFSDQPAAEHRQSAAANHVNEIMLFGRQGRN
jgi:hypothetical protein